MSRDAGKSKGAGSRSSKRRGGRRIRRIRDYNDAEFPDSNITQNQLRTGDSRQPRTSVFERRSGGEPNATSGRRDTAQQEQGPDPEAAAEAAEVVEPDSQ